MKATSNKALKKILLIKTDNIGDFILWTDAGKEYKNIFPADDYEITLLGNSIWADLAQRTNYFADVISLDRKKFMLHPFYRIRKMKEIISVNWHTVIYHSFSHEFGTGLSILKHIKSENIIAAPSDDGIDNKWWRNFAKRELTQTAHLDKEESHELKKNAAFIRSFGHSYFVDSIPDLKFLGNPPNIHLQQPYYVIFPGASSPARKWNESNFVELCNFIYERTGWTGVLCGGITEKNLADNILEKSKAKLTSIAGKTSLQEFLTVLQNSELVVTNETSCTHMAASVNTPVICILGGGHFGRFLPYPTYENRKTPISIYYEMNCFNCNWNCKYRPTKFQAAPCIENISLKQVIQSVNTILEEK
ncbi:MAG: glycosyltransferase family 9 protein [Chitinophagaceae bacterium]|nr:glycosyltransferase family 9 protein [Chitinophagaceae bacterium]